MKTTDKPKRVNGEGSVYFRKSDQRWCATLSLPSPDGKQRRVTRTAMTEKLANVKLTELKREKLKTGDIPTATQTLESWLNVWFTTIAAKKNRPKTMATWRSVINNHIVPSVGRVQLAKLTPAHVRKMEDDIIAKGLRPTAILAYAILSRALEYAVREGRVASKVTDRTDPPVRATTNLVVLSAADGVKVLRTVFDDRLGSLRSANLLTGARQGELLGLELDRVKTLEQDGRQYTFLDLSWQLQRISWEHGCGGVKSHDPKSGKAIYECGNKNAAVCPARKITKPPNWEHRYITGGLWLARPKSDAGKRLVPLVEPLKTLIERRIAAAALEPNPHGLVWTADPKKDRHGRLQPLDGSPIDPSWDNANWHDTLERAGVPQARLHDARHTTASLLRKANVPTETITRILGHSSQAMSEKYIDYDFDQLTHAMAGMSALMIEPADPH